MSAHAKSIYLTAPADTQVCPCQQPSKGWQNHDFCFSLDPGMTMMDGAGVGAGAGAAASCGGNIIWGCGAGAGTVLMTALATCDEGPGAQLGEELLR